MGGLSVPAPSTAASAPDMHKSPPIGLSEGDRGTDGNVNDEGLGTNKGRGLRLGTKVKSNVAATTGIFEAGEPTDSTGRKPAVEAPVWVDTVSEALVFRTEMPRILNTQGGSDRPLQEPSVQQELTGMTAQEGLPSAKRCVQGATRGHYNTMMQQEEEEDHSVEDRRLEATRNILSYIPKRLNRDYKPFLKATSEDFARGTLHELKCKLCPASDFTTWDGFTRHCKTAEAHPLEVFVCGYCGDFFARYDSFQRHSENQPPECLRVSPREAEDKRTETKRIHEEFRKNLKVHLETNEGNWKPFAQIIKEKYPKSSKR
jgi:hypothetical protein